MSRRARRRPRASASRGRPDRPLRSARPTTLTRGQSGLKPQSRSRRGRAEQPGQLQHRRVMQPTDASRFFDADTWARLRQVKAHYDPDRLLQRQPSHPAHLFDANAEDFCPGVAVSHQASSWCTLRLQIPVQYWDCARHEYSIARRSMWCDPRRRRVRRVYSWPSWSAPSVLRHTSCRERRLASKCSEQELRTGAGSASRWPRRRSCGSPAAPPCEFLLTLVTDGLGRRQPSGRVVVSRHHGRRRGRGGGR